MLVNTICRGREKVSAKFPYSAPLERGGDREIKREVIEMAKVFNVNICNESFTECRDCGMCKCFNCNYYFKKYVTVGGYEVGNCWKLKKEVNAQSDKCSYFERNRKELVVAEG